VEVVRQRNATNRLPGRDNVIERVRRQRLGQLKAFLREATRLLHQTNLAEPERQRIRVLGRRTIVPEEPLVLALLPDLTERRPRSDFLVNNQNVYRWATVS
jgi:hypothetical protein